MHSSFARVRWRIIIVVAFVLGAAPLIGRLRKKARLEGRVSIGVAAPGKLLHSSSSSSERELDHVPEKATAAGGVDAQRTASDSDSGEAG